MPDPKNKKVSRDTIRINKPSKIYKPNDLVTEDDFEKQFAQIKGDSSTFPQQSVEDYSNIQVDDKGPYVVRNSSNQMKTEGSALYAKISSACKAAAKKKFKVWPSAYASGWGVRCTKAGGPSKFGGGKKKK